MLEAFQASERATEERAVMEQRRLAAEREKDVRREESARSAQEWKRRIGEGVGSLFGPKRPEGDDLASSGDYEDHEHADELGEEGGPETDAVVVAGPPSSSPPSADVGTHGAAGSGANSGPVEDAVQVTSAAPGRGREPSWSSSGIDESEFVDASPPSAGAVAQQDLSQNDTGDAAPGAHSHEHGAAGSAEVSAGAPGAQDGEAAAEALDAERPEGASDPMGDEETAGVSSDGPSLDELEAALVDPEEFALPMSGRTFGIILGVALATVFVLGLSIGGASGDEPVHAGSGSGRTADPSSAGARFERPDPAAGAANDGAPVVLAPPGASRAGIGGAGGGIAEEERVEGPALDPGLTGADRAFFDPAMKYTIMAIVYERNTTNESLAWEAYDLLAAKGFPVVQPVPVEQRIFIFVGAAETVAELKTLKGELRSLKVGGSGQKEFHDAFVVNADRYR